VADGDLAVLDDDGDPAPAARVHEHLVEEGAGLLDVAVLDGISLARIGLPGLARVGSAVLAVDDDGSLAHIFLIIGSASRPTGAGGACGIA
jgi:hypothetical protein